MGAALVTQSIANLFKLSAQGDRTTLDLLQEYLAGKHLLLILDNCEHLVDACAEIAEGLLHHCWQLHILATSREELRIPGETVYPVLPLALPNPAERAPDRVLASAAAQLFVERMGVSSPTLKAQDEDVAAIAHICRQLDGIPLALELAAPLVRSMTLAEIAAQLHDQMAILTNNYRTAIPRHQTMHSALVWSYRLLAPAEQQLLAQTIGLRGRVDVGGGAGGQQPTTPGPIFPCHCSSLSPNRLRWWKTPTASAAIACWSRCASLPTPSWWPAVTGTKRVAATLPIFLTLAEQMEQARDTPQEREWLRTLEPERDNLRAVNGWALEHNEAEFAQRFNGSLFAFWIYCTSLAEAHHWLEAALALQPAATGAERTTAALSSEALALDTAGYAAVLLHNGRAQAWFERELALYAELGDQRGIATALRGCGFTAMLRDDLAHAQLCDEQALALSRAAQDHRGVAWALFDLGYLALVRGELPAAQALLAEALPQLLEQGITFGAFRALLALGHVMRALGETDRARQFYRDALHLQRPMHYSQYVAEGLEGLAGIAAQDGDPVRAARLFGRCPHPA